MLSDNVWDDNKQDQPHWKTVKRTVDPRQHLKNKLWTRTMKSDSVAIALNAMNQRLHHISLKLLRFCSHLQCFAKRYRHDAHFPNVCTKTSTISDYISSTCMDRDHATNPSRVESDYNPPKANVSEANVSAHVRNDVRLYQPTTLVIERDE